MRTLRNLSCLAIIGLMAAGCVTHQTAKLDAAYALNGASTISESPRAASTGVASATAGDNFTAANLFEQARAGYDNPINRFNLAASYAKTGRTTQAIALYASVVRDGQFTKAMTNRMNDDQMGPSSRVNLAEESQRRIVVLNGKLGSAIAADAHGVDVAAIVGAPRSAGQMSDRQAIMLDEAIEASTAG